MGLLYHVFTFWIRNGNLLFAMESEPKSGPKSMKELFLHWETFRWIWTTDNSDDVFVSFIRKRNVKAVWKWTTWRHVCFTIKPKVWKNVRIDAHMFSVWSTSSFILDRRRILITTSYLQSRTGYFRQKALLRVATHIKLAEITNAHCINRSAN